MFILIFQNRQPHSLCSDTDKQCCSFALRVQDLLHVIEVYVVMVNEDSIELFTCALILTSAICS